MTAGVDNAPGTGTAMARTHPHRSSAVGHTASVVTSPVAQRSHEEPEAALERVAEPPVDAQPTALRARAAALVAGPPGTVPVWS